MQAITVPATYKKDVLAKLSIMSCGRARSESGKKDRKGGKQRGEWRGVGEEAWTLDTGRQQERSAEPSVQPWGSAEERGMADGFKQGLPSLSLGKERPWKLLQRVCYTRSALHSHVMTSSRPSVCRVSGDGANSRRGCYSWRNKYGPTCLTSVCRRLRMSCSCVSAGGLGTGTNSCDSLGTAGGWPGVPETHFKNSFHNTFVHSGLKTLISKVKEKRGTSELKYRPTLNVRTRQDRGQCGAVSFF